MYLRTISQELLMSVSRNMFSKIKLIKWLQHPIGDNELILTNMSLNVMQRVSVFPSDKPTISIATVLQGTAFY